MIGSNQTVFFRADASATIGSGHVMRCLTLADEVKEQNCSCAFICADLPGHMMGYIQQRGYDVHLLQDTDSVAETTEVLKLYKPDWLVIDHYGIDESKERLWRLDVSKILVVDDLANRPHDCDVLLDQNYVIDYEHRYDSLVPSHCTKLLGPCYALLRPEFYKAREKLQPRNGEIKRVLVFFSGSDPTCETVKFMNAMPNLVHLGLYYDVVVGSSNPHKDQLAALCQLWPQVTFHCQIDYMARLMVQADLAVGAGGTATWERAFLALPSVVTVVAHNQAEVVAAVAQQGAVLSLGDHSQVEPKDYQQVLEKLVQAPEQVQAMSVQAEKLMNLSERGCNL